MPTEPQGPRDFATTHWSIVVKAANEDHQSQITALNHLCETYWHPLYFYVLRKGQSATDAKDIIQGFFAKLIEKNYLQNVDRNCGSFRMFLRMAISRYMANEWDKAKAKKRGGDHVIMSLDFIQADREFIAQPQTGDSDEISFDREWAQTILNRVFQSLKSRYEAKDDDHWYGFLRSTLPDQTQPMTYEEAAREFDCSVNTVKSKAHRFRQQFQERLREAVLETVTNEEDLEDEIRHLVQVLSS